MIPSVARQINNQLRSAFGKRLHSVLLYGSSKISNKYWDIDILVILIDNQFNVHDLGVLKSIINENRNTILDLQLIYKNEIRSSNIFSLDAHGAFFSRILKRATVLHGVNPFVNFEPGKAYLLISLINRIQRYLFQARQEYILGGRYIKDKNPKYHHKHVLRSMFDLLLMNVDWLENKEIKRLFISKYPYVFDKNDWRLLESEGDNIEKYIVLYEKIYDLALTEVYKMNI